MIATVISVVLIMLALSAYSVLLLGVCAGAAYRNGFRAGQNDTTTTPPTNVRVLR